MSYKISAKNRKLKRTLLSILGILKFESLHIETPKKVVLFGVIISLFALFLNWTEAIDQKHVGNVFKSFLGITGYILMITNIKILFIILSDKMKDIMKMFFNFHAKDGVMIVFLGMFGLFFSINSVFIIENFSYFTTGILVGKGIILAIVGYIFIITGGFFMLKNKTKTSIYVDGDNFGEENSIENESEKNNMKLPF